MIYLSFVAALFASILLMPLLIRLAAPWGFVDIPDARKVHQTAVPRIGGIVIAISAIITLLLIYFNDQQVIIYVVSASIIVFFGAWDDRANLNYKVKFFGQIVAASTIVLVGEVRLEYLPFLGLEKLPDSVSIPLSIFFLVAVTNSTNLIDGLDGLAGGLTLMTLGAIAVFENRLGAQAGLCIALCVGGAVLGFLRFNTHPASVFMGDSGSQFLGFTTGYLVLNLGHEQQGAISPMIGLLCIGLPLIDTATVFIQRILKGQSPFKPDRSHLHHQLMNIGLTHAETVVFIYLAQALFIMMAFFLYVQSDFEITFAYVALAAGFVGGLKMLSANPQIGSRVLGAVYGPLLGTLSKRSYEVIKLEPMLPWCIYLIMGVLLCLGLIMHLNWRDILWLAIFMLGLMLYRHFAKNDPERSLIKKIVMYCLAALIVFSTGTHNQLTHEYTVLVELLFTSVLVILLLGGMLSSGDKFDINPMDYLVVFLAILIPRAGLLVTPEMNWGEMVSRMIILFYAVEYMFSLRESMQNALSKGTLAGWSVVLIAALFQVAATV